MKILDFVAISTPLTKLFIALPNTYSVLRCGGQEASLVGHGEGGG